MMFALVEMFLSALWGKLHDYLSSSLFEYLIGLCLSQWPKLLPTLISFLVIMMSMKLLSLRKNLKESVARISGFNKRLDELHHDLRYTQPKNPESQEWLENLEDLAYDMEDLLDDYETMQRLRMESSWISVLPIYLKYHKVFAEAKAITIRLEESNKRKEELRLSLTTAIVPTSLPPRAPGSMSAEPILYGREREKKEIIDLLLRPSDGRQRFDVIPVVGMGGLGKTTIAQHVYQDDQVSSFFDVRVWSCASMDFDRCRILQSIVGSSDTYNLCSLERQVHEKFKNKKFLVVLDDVWAESILELDRFWAPFMQAAPGSKFIMTTRDSKLGRSIRMAVTGVELGLLSEEECWSLFCWHSNIGSSSHLVDIGKEISKKCRGLPLAAAVIGSLLRGTDDEGEWKNVLNDKSWVSKNGQHEIASVLKLSYDRLPFYLKRCFAICTIYPEDFKFTRQSLVIDWMSNGIIKCGRDGKDWKDVGGGYFDDLVSRCFLLKDGLAKTHVMHDLIREMGQEVCGDRYFAESRTKSVVSLEKVRHIALMYKSTLMDCVDFEKQKVMPWRTLIFSEIDPGIHKDFGTIFSKLPKLRSLNFGNSKITKLSICLGLLKHLRYLYIRCEKLTELPIDIGGLSKLLVLCILNCPLLTELPSEIGRLSSLLELYVENCPGLAKLPSEIKSLINLSKLIIWKCPQLIALPSEIGRLSSLYDLRIRNCPGLNKLPSEIKSLSNLSSLFIFDCPNLSELPLEIGSLSSLSTLVIRCCPGLTKLPRQIWSLSSLSVLSVCQCQGLTDLGLEEMGSLSPLSKLFVSEIPWLVKLQEIESLPHLSTLFIAGCGELSEIPAEIGRLTSLTTLVIGGFSELLRVPKEIGNLTNLNALYIENCPRLTELPKEIENLSNLSTLYIEDCPGLAEVRTYYDKDQDIKSWSKQSRRDLLWGSKATHIWNF